MNLDIRLPIGLMFAIIGALITIYGVITMNDAQIYARSGGTNVNLYWGIVLLIFGLIMFSLGRRAAARNRETVHTAMDSPEGVATEQREQDLGLENNTPRGQ